ncbi:hypothetical protein EGR_06892 [Echinococcus granulosus]|uniref:Matrix-remodeling-associated protein 7 helical domain-containing protein n=1 Tax=Echinococcus granulosus TaxID=6210 RepID=W6UJF2_ECHGR|nr:hypothetical protein EGR_06892 [Echinococcus granulosus]EUB58257.1 hypothetical protein EGR_06892 [Echinococcus granulosus]
MDSFHLELSIVIYTLLTVFVGICGVIASWCLLKRKVTPHFETSHRNIRESYISSRKSAAKRVELLSHLPSRVKRLHEMQQLAELSAKEREAEMLARCNQLAAILEVMQQQPEHFGQVSQDDLSAQLSAFYSATTALATPSIA